MKKITRRDFVPMFGAAVAGGALLSFNTSKSREEKFIAYKGKTTPKGLNEGDTIGICAPAGAIRSESEISSFQNRLEQLGFKTQLGKNIRKREGYLAGSDAERAHDLMEFIQDENVKGIFFIRGGWGSARLLPLLDLDKIKANPKVIMGFSDVTTLLNVITDKCGFITFHGPSGNSTWNDYSVEYIKKLLIEKNTVSFQNKEGDHAVRTINKGQAMGELWGGNLTVITSLLGTNYMPSMEGGILFLEDVDEEPYSIDRMLTQLSLAGIFNSVQGVILGNFRKCIAEEPDRSFTLDEVFDQHFKKLNIPVYYGAQIGHIRNKFTVPVGSRVMMDADECYFQLMEPAVV